MKKAEKRQDGLTTDELRLVSQVLFISRWSGAEWQQTIIPLINKNAQLIDKQGGDAGAVEGGEKDKEGMADQTV